MARMHVIDKATGAVCRVDVRSARILLALGKAERLPMADEDGCGDDKTTVLTEVLSKEPGRVVVSMTIPAAYQTRHLEAEPAPEAKRRGRTPKSKSLD